VLVNDPFCVRRVDSCSEIRDARCRLAMQSQQRVTALRQSRVKNAKGGCVISFDTVREIAAHCRGSRPGDYALLRLPPASRGRLPGAWRDLRGLSREKFC
jgi:hypothetical protein